ncbi:MAG TPA: ankyrin repeat domain-containing protein [Vicinamibacterales bacterium]|nr:ankyrin repeat domain-containing protein [Vicinamibacterales bacterium]
MKRVLHAITACSVATAVMVAVVIGAGDSPLTKAVKSENLQSVRTLIKQGADVNVKAGDGSTPLLQAVDYGNLEIARALVGAKARVDIANDFGVTPLLHAARTGNAQMVDLLLRAGASPSLAHPEGETPLMAAAGSGSVAAVRALLARGANVNATDKFQTATALMWAAAEGHIEVAGLLLEAGADPNKQAAITSLTQRKNADHPTGGFTALMWAARNGSETMVRRLATGGANLNLKNGDGASAMMIAIWNDRFDMAATLAELGADVNDGSLYMAVEMRDASTDQFAFDGSRRRPDNPNKLTALDLMKVLLDKGADPNKRFSGQLHSTSMPNSDRFDNTPFYRASITADVEALKLLVKYKADLEQSPGANTAPTGADAPPDDMPAAGRGRGNPNAGRTPAMVAMAGGRGPGMTGGPGYIRDGAVPYREPGSRKPDDAFKVLIEAGANPNAKAPDGQTLLHQVARAGNLELIRTLAAAKVDFEQKNNDGLTALDVAEGKQPAGRAAAAGPGRGRGGAPPGGRGGRGGRGAASQQDVAKLLRELMGLPPAPPAPPATETPAAPAAAPAADAPAEAAAAEAQ